MGISKTNNILIDSCIFSENHCNGVEYKFFRYYSYRYLKKLGGIINFRELTTQHNITIIFSIFHHNNVEGVPRIFFFLTL